MVRIALPHPVGVKIAVQAARFEVEAVDRSAHVALQPEAKSPLIGELGQVFGLVDLVSNLGVGEVCRIEYLPRAPPLRRNIRCRLRERRKAGELLSMLGPELLQGLEHMAVKE